MRNLLATPSGIDETELLCTKYAGQTPCVLRMATNAKVSRSTAGELMSEEIQLAEGAT
jgi:hypothetical protein